MNRKYDWRAHLTPDEREQIEAMDRAKAEWDRLSVARPKILNRALQRAKYRSKLVSSPTTPSTRD